MIEDIIYWLTVFEDKDIVKRKINKQYPDRLTDEQLKKILKLKFKGWGRFSRKFLAGIKGEKAYFVLVKYCIEKALKKSVKKEYHMEFVEIPVYIARGIKNNDINLYDYVCDILNEANKNSVADVEILRNKVPKYQMIIGENGEEYYLVSATEVINSKQFVLGGANQQYNRLLNYIKYGKNDKWQYIQNIYKLHFIIRIKCFINVIKYNFVHKNSERLH
jgi:hypothetical protein